MSTIQKEIDSNFGQEGQRPNVCDKVPSSVFLLMLIVYSLWPADSIIPVTARVYDATLWTQDEPFKGIERVRYKDIETKNKSQCYANFRLIDGYQILL